jgi:hypothetical protein
MNSGFKIEVTEVKGQEKGVQVRIWLEGESGGAFIRMMYDSYEEMAAAFKKIYARLDAVLEEGKNLFAKTKETEPTMAAAFISVDDPVENWKRLQELETDEEFFHAFNQMSDERRRAVSDYVFTTENIFKGRASVFSLHFSEEKGTLE